MPWKCGHSGELVWREHSHLVFFSVTLSLYVIRQFHDHVQLLKAKNYCTIKLGRQNGRLLQWPKCSCVSTKTKLWKIFLRPVICIPSLIVQWPDRLWNWLIHTISVYAAISITIFLSLSLPPSILLYFIDFYISITRSRYLPTYLPIYLLSMSISSLHLHLHPAVTITIFYLYLVVSGLQALLTLSTWVSSFTSMCQPISQLKACASP